MVRARPPQLRAASAPRAQPRRTPACATAPGAAAAAGRTRGGVSSQRPVKMCFTNSRGHWRARCGGGRLAVRWVMTCRNSRGGASAPPPPPPPPPARPVRTHRRLDLQQALLHEHVVGSRLALRPRRAVVRLLALLRARARCLDGRVEQARKLPHVVRNRRAVRRQRRAVNVAQPKRQRRHLLLQLLLVIVVGALHC